MPLGSSLKVFLNQGRSSIREWIKIKPGSGVILKALSRHIPRHIPGTRTSSVAYKAFSQPGLPHVVVIITLGAGQGPSCRHPHSTDEEAKVWEG